MSRVFYNQHYFQKIGDCIIIQVFLDEFNTTVPLGNASSAYKLLGCYFTILNLPPWLQEDLDFIFLKFLAFASDVDAAKAETLKCLVIAELQVNLSTFSAVYFIFQELEKNGIVIERFDRQILVKVVLLQLVGDNLGLQDAYGLQKSFRLGLCRHCKALPNEMRTMSSIGLLRTVEEYNDVVNGRDLETMRQHGIVRQCPFHVLENYHFLAAPTVDLMHDVLEGHLHYLMVGIYRELQNEFNIASVNDFIESFPYVGRYRKNKPTGLEVNDSNKIKDYSAKKMFNLVRLLPLILARHHTFPTGPLWRCLLMFQYVMDYLFALEMPESKLQYLDNAIEDYVQLFIDAGGHITPKTHYLLHYVHVIRLLGMPRYYWAMRFEANHQVIKQYGNVNCCHKNLPQTLANKVQIKCLSVVRKIVDGNRFGWFFCKNNIYF